MNMNRIGFKGIFDFLDEIKNSNMPFVPNLILTVDRGNGRSFLTKAYVEAIEDKMDFSSTQKYLEFDFDESDYNVNTIKEMIGTIKSCSGTKNDFAGVVAIGVDVFLNHEGEYPTMFFIKKMKEISNKNATIIFFISQKYKNNTFVRRLKEVEPVYYIDSDYSSDEIAEIAFENVSKLVPKILEKEQKKEALENAFRCKKIKNIKEATAFLKKLVIDDFINKGENNDESF